jgi:hypothetical protein
MNLPDKSGKAVIPLSPSKLSFMFLWITHEIL